MKLPHQVNDNHFDRTRQAYPVELLRDGAGIYGIGTKEMEVDYCPRNYYSAADVAPLN
jgi:hypothetical protein